MSITQIAEGSRFINERLKDKGYFSGSGTANSGELDRILFNSIDLKKLTTTTENESTDIDTEIVITKKMIENDKNVINVMYELLDNLERSKKMKEVTLSQYQQQQNEIIKLNKQNSSLSQRVESMEDTIHGKDLEIMKLKQDLKESTINKRLVLKERNALKILNENLKEKQRIELNKKNIEIDELKEKLIIKLNSISIGSKGSLQQQQQQQQQQLQQQSLVAPQLQLQTELGPATRVSTTTTTQITNLLDSQTCKLLENSSNIIYELILQNEQNSKFLNAMNKYLDQLILKLGHTNNSDKHNLIIPSFTDFIQDIRQSSTLTGEKLKIDNDIQVAMGEMTNFENLKTKFIQNLINFDNLMKNYIIAGGSNSNSNTSTTEYDRLIDEIESLKKNWQKANSNAENWKTLYKQATAASEASAEDAYSSRRGA